MKIGENLIFGKVVKKKKQIPTIFVENAVSVFSFIRPQPFSSFLQAQ